MVSLTLPRLAFDPVAYLKATDILGQQDRIRIIATPLFMKHFFRQLDIFLEVWCKAIPKRSKNHC